MKGTFHINKSVLGEVIKTLIESVKNAKENTNSHFIKTELAEFFIDTLEIVLEVCTELL